MSIKPPLGIRPRWLHDFERARDLFEAIMRYAAAGQPVNVEWANELNEHIQRHHLQAPECFAKPAPALEDPSAGPRWHTPATCVECRLGLTVLYCLNGHATHNRGDCPYCDAPAGLHNDPKAPRTRPPGYRADAMQERKDR